MTDIPTQEDRLPKYMGLAELKGQRYNGTFDPLLEPKLSWWQRFKAWLGENRRLKEENALLQAKVVSLTIAVQDAGRHGLNLFAENEALHTLVGGLKDQIKDPAAFVQYKEYWSDEYLKAKKEMDMLQWQHDGLREAYGRILEDWSKLTGVNND
jgi:hypothetical protein